MHWDDRDSVTQRVDAMLSTLQQLPLVNKDPLFPCREQWRENHRAVRELKSSIDPPTPCNLHSAR